MVLTEQQKSGQVCTYQMDSVGNLEVMWEAGANPKTFTFDAADKLTTMAEGTALTTYTWTSYGALEVEQLGSRRTTYTYSGQDQLIGAVSSQSQSTYTFDGDGLRRTAEEGTNGKVTMVWDGSDYLFLDGPSSDSLVLTLDGEIVSCGTKDLLTDPLGSLVKEISSGASLGSLIEMYPYGTLVSGTGTPTIPYVYIARYGYYFDNEQRDYVRARQLYKALGRWMQEDAYSLIPYGYAGTSPIRLIDSNGGNPHKPDQAWHPPQFDFDCPTGSDPPATLVTNYPSEFCKRLKDCYQQPVCRQKLFSCLKDYGLIVGIRDYETELMAICGWGGKRKIAISCGGCICALRPNRCGYTFGDFTSTNYCKIHICPKSKSKDCGSSVAWTITHEMMHCIGADDSDDQADNIGTCIMQVLNFPI